MRKQLKWKPFGIKQQFPLEIENKRKQLYSVMKEVDENGHFTGMVRDKDDVTEDTNVKEVAVEDQPCIPQNPPLYRQADIRPRSSSTPDNHY